MMNEFDLLIESCIESKKKLGTLTMASACHLQNKVIRVTSSSQLELQGPQLSPIELHGLHSPTVYV